MSTVERGPALEHRRRRAVGTASSAAWLLGAVLLGGCQGSVYANASLHGGFSAGEDAGTDVNAADAEGSAPGTEGGTASLNDAGAGNPRADASAGPPDSSVADPDSTTSPADSGVAPTDSGTAVGDSGADASSPNGGSDSGLPATGTAGVGAPVAFPLRISADKKNLLDQNGKPFLMVGDAAWVLPTQLSDSETIAYLDDRKARGFNTLLMEMMERKFSTHSPAWRNAAGEVPFDNVNDFTTTRAAFFDRAAWLFEQAESRGMLVLVTPSYIGYGCADEGWCQEMFANGVDKLTSYGRFLGERFRDSPNIIWVEGGDLTPSTAGSPSQLALISAIAHGIEAGDGGSHLHTAHWSRSTSSTEGPSVDWLDIDASYSGALRLTYQDCLADWGRDAGKRPLFLIEGYYETSANVSAVDLRAQMYQPVLSGGMGFVYGHHSIWFFGRPGDGNPGWSFVSGPQVSWSTALGTAGARHVTLARDLLVTLEWSQLRPDTTHRILTAGFTGSGAEQNALLASTPDGRLAVAYMTSRLAITIDLGAFSGSVTASWYDPTNGVRTAISTSANSGARTFTPPGNNSEGSGDWVLVLQVQ